MTIIQEYLQLIEKQNFDQVDTFLIYFSEQLDQKIFAALERTDEEYFSYFTKVFLQQLSNQTNEDKILLNLHVFYQIQTNFRIFSYFILDQEQNIEILKKIFDLDNLQIKNELILIFTEFLTIDPHIFNSLGEILLSLFQIDDPTIFQSLLNFFNKHLIELSEKTLSQQDYLSIEPLMYATLSREEKIDSKTLNVLAIVLKNILNNSLNLFLTHFDRKMLDFIEQLLIKSSIDQDNSQMASLNVLNSILILTSSRIPSSFKSKTAIIFENFDLSIFLETLKSDECIISILSVQSILNFVLGGSADRIISNTEIIDCLSKELEVGKFKVKQEIALLFSKMSAVSSMDYKVNFLLDKNILILIFDLLPSFDNVYVLDILQNLVNSLSQCSNIANFEDIKNNLIDVRVLEVFDLIDCEAENEVVSEIQRINHLFVELLENH